MSVTIHQCSQGAYSLDRLALHGVQNRRVESFEELIRELREEFEEKNSASPEAVARTPAKLVAETCPHCHGLGMVDCTMESMTSCPICNGTGEI